MRHKVSIFILIATIALGLSLVLAPSASTVSKSGTGANPPAPAPPGVIPAGLDLYTTPCNGSSYWDFGVLGLGQNFFGDGSDEFSEPVKLKGLPLSIADPEHYSAAYGTTDTIMRRNESAAIPGAGDSASVPVELLALSLASCNSFTVTYGGALPEQWNLSVSVAPNAIGSVNIQNACGFENGGTFDSGIRGFPILVFTRVSDGATRTWDFQDFQTPWVLLGSGNKWSSSAPDSFNLLSVPPDPLRNFFAGVWKPPCLEGDCGARSKALEVMVRHSWSPFPPRGVAVAVHTMLPTAMPPSSDSDADQIPNDADNCPTIYNPLQENSDGDTKGDVCDGNPSRYDVCTVMIGGCDTGVPNHSFPTGVTFNDLITECASGPDEFVSCVAHLTNEWKAAGLITGAQKGAIMRCATHGRP